MCDKIRIHIWHDVFDNIVDANSAIADKGYSALCKRYYVVKEEEIEKIINRLAPQIDKRIVIYTNR